MNIFKQKECEHCIHEYAPTNCPCCNECEVKKKNPNGFMEANKTGKNEKENPKNIMDAAMKGKIGE